GRISEAIPALVHRHHKVIEKAGMGGRGRLPGAAQRKQVWREAELRVRDRVADLRGIDLADSANSRRLTLPLPTPMLPVVLQPVRGGNHRQRYHAEYKRG